jgi:hypothetical protein
MDDRSSQLRKLGRTQRQVLLYFLDHPDGWFPMSKVGESNDVQKAINTLTPRFLERITVGALRDHGYEGEWTRDVHFRPEAPAYRLAQPDRVKALDVVRAAMDAFLNSPQWDEFVFTRAFQTYLNHQGVSYLSNLFGRFALGLRSKLDMDIMRRYIGEKYEANLVAKATIECLHAADRMEDFWTCWEQRLRE